MDKKPIPNFLHVFEQKFDNLYQKIDNHYSVAKNERDREKLKTLLQEAKKTRRLIKEIKKEHASVCPHCHKKIP